MKLSCFKCHFESFFTTVANDKAGHQPVPFDITSFSFTSTMTDRPHKRDWVPFEICTSLIIHLVCLQTFCIRIEFNFSWDDYNTQEKLKAKVMQNFRRQTTCITRVVQMGNAVIAKRSLYQCVTFTFTAFVFLVGDCNVTCSRAYCEVIGCMNLDSKLVPVHYRDQE